MSWRPAGQTFNRATPILAITTAAAPAALNVSNEGTLDWFAQGSLTTQPISDGTPQNVHSKIGPGYLLNTYRWVNGGGGTNAVFSDFAGSTPALTSASGDDTAGAAFAAFANLCFLAVVSATEIGFGFTFRFPASLVSRICRVYTNQYSCDLTLTARLTAPDGSSLSTSATRLAAAGASNPSVFAITFTGSAPGSWLDVRGLVTANHHDASNNLNMNCSAVTVGVV